MRRVLDVQLNIALHGREASLRRWNLATKLLRPRAMGLRGCPSEFRGPSPADQLLAASVSSPDDDAHLLRPQTLVFPEPAVSIVPIPSVTDEAKGHGIRPGSPDHVLELQGADPVGGLPAFQAYDEYDSTVARRAQLVVGRDVLNLP